jgi:hypothetical protein
MVDTSHMISDNGATPPGDSRLSLPDSVTLSIAEMQQFPSPGTQRALKAETGRDYLTMVGPDADSADRTQTAIWVRLRKDIPGLRWDQCDEVVLQIADAEGLEVDPTKLASSVPSPLSAGSGA